MFNEVSKSIPCVASEEDIVKNICREMAIRFENEIILLQSKLNLNLKKSEVLCLNTALTSLITSKMWLNKFAHNDC